MLNNTDDYKLLALIRRPPTRHHWFILLHVGIGYKWKYWMWELQMAKCLENIKFYLSQL